MEDNSDSQPVEVKDITRLEEKEAIVKIRKARSRPWYHSILTFVNEQYEFNLT